MSQNQEGRGFFRRAFDNIIEARSRAAKAQVEQYLQRYEQAIGGRR